MGVIDVDHEILSANARVAMHAAEQMMVHIAAEIKGDIDGLMETLVPEGPYAYAIKPELNPDGSVTIPIATTPEEIREWYKLIRGMSALLPGWPVIEVFGDWYTFQESISRGRRKGSDTVTESPTIALFPSARGSGITGELVWYRMPGVGSGITPGGTGNQTDLRKLGLEHHDRYVEALRTSNVDGILEIFTDHAQSAVRDYANDTGTLIGLHGAVDHSSYYRSLFDKYEILRVDRMHRVAQDWYVFAELHVTVRARHEPAQERTLSFRNAEFFIPGNDGRFIARIGHGTDPMQDLLEAHP
jgi:hypothetical protein